MTLAEGQGVHRVPLSAGNQVLWSLMVAVRMDDGPKLEDALGELAIPESSLAVRGVIWCMKALVRKIYANRRYQ